MLLDKLFIRLFSYLDSLMIDDSMTCYFKLELFYYQEKISTKGGLQGSTPITLFHQPLTSDRSKTFKSSFTPLPFQPYASIFHTSEEPFLPPSLPRAAAHVEVSFNFISYSNCSSFCIYKFIAHRARLDGSHWSRH